MNNLINELKKEIENENYYIDNYKFLNGVMAKLEHIKVLCLEGKLNEIFQELKQLDIFALERALITILYYDKDRQTQDKYIEALDTYINDKEYKDKTRFDALICLRAYVNGLTLNNVLAKKTRQIYDEFFVPIYGDTNSQVYMELCKNRHFITFFRLLFDYRALLKQKSLSDEQMIRSIIDLANEINLHYSEYSECDYYNFKMFIHILDNFLVYSDDKLQQVRKDIRSRLKRCNNLQQKINSLQKIYNKEYKEFISSKDLQAIMIDDINSKMYVQILEDVVKANGYLLNKKEMYFGPRERLENLLLKYQYTYELLSDECKNAVAIISIDKLDKDLTKLKSLSIFLTYDNLSRVMLEGLGDFDDRLRVFITKGYVDNAFINNNIEVLLDSSLFSRLCDNIDTLVNNNIDIRKLSNIDSLILLSDNNYLKAMLNMYLGYNVEVTDDNISNILDINNLDLLDSFIEEGCSNFIRNNTNYLCSDGNKLVKRIHINGLIGEESIVNGKLDDSLQNQGVFFVPDYKLDEVCCNQASRFQDRRLLDILSCSKRLYISDDVIDSDYIKMLDEKYLDEGNYNINGVVISRIKVLRNMEVLKNVDYCLLDKIFNSMIYNSILTIDEVYALRDATHDDKIRKIVRN